MEDIVKRHREMMSSRIQQSFALQNEDQSLLKADEYNDLEKARVVRQDGDIHPNGKWVWVSSAAGGKGDWRVIKKQKDGAAAPASSNTEKKDTKSDNGAASKSSEALTKTLDNMSIEELTELESIIASAIDKKKEAPTPVAPEVSEPAKTKKEDADSSKVVDAPKMTDKEFNDDVKRVVDASALKDPASKSGAVEMLTAAKDRFGDKVRVELHNPSRNPTAIVDFGNGLELGFSYRNDGYTYTFWKLSGFEEEFAMKLKERGFDVRNYNDSPITHLDAEINNARAMLRRINNEDDEFAWTVNLNRLKAIKNKLEREFKAFKL